MGSSNSARWNVMQQASILAVSQNFTVLNEGELKEIDNLAHLMQVLKQSEEALNFKVSIELTQQSFPDQKLFIFELGETSLIQSPIKLIKFLETCKPDFDEVLLPKMWDNTFSVELKSEEENNVSHQQSRI